MEQFIQGQEMMFISTADARGQCDCSFRAGSAGFVRVLNSKTLLYPEYRGNGVLASVGNIEENPHIGIIFVDFCQTTVGLHVNGRARLLAPEAIRSMPDVMKHLPPAEDTSGGRQPVCWVLVEVEEAYIHARSMCRYSRSSTRRSDGEPTMKPSKEETSFASRHRREPPSRMLLLRPAIPRPST